MANFQTALKRTEKYEGGYADDSDDLGAETYKGISRKANPGWEGWPLVDNYKKRYKNFKTHLDKDNELQKKVESLYRDNYWTPVRGDEINSQKMAEEIFDMAVNAGVSKAVKLAQKMVGLPQSGVMTTATVERLNRTKT